MTRQCTEVMLIALQGALTKADGILPYKKRFGLQGFGYARSYVILNEFTAELARKFFTAIKDDDDINTSNLFEAIYVMAVLWLKESNAKQTHDLIEYIEKNIFA